MSIRPDLLAGKLAAGNFDASCFENHPRLAGRWRELLWFVQAAAMPVRGLERLVETLFADCGPRFSTDSMRAAGAPVDGRFSPAQCLIAWKTFNSKLSLRHVCRFDQQPEEGRGQREGNPEYFGEWLSMHYRPRLTVDHLARGEDCSPSAIAAGIERFNWSFLNDFCRSRAQSGLEGFITDLCTRPDIQFEPPWWCVDLFDLILDHMDRHAAGIESGIVKTKVTQIVFRELEFAITQNVPVRIVGESRIGKTSSVSVWCAMRPGRSRLVTVPDCGREKDFMRAHADAFGIEYNPTVTLQKLKWDVEFVHRHSGLFIAYEEAHYLVPVRYGKTTPPARIDWIRNQVIDRELGCAFLATPQSYNQTLDQFVKTTGHNISQWLGRLAPVVVLPADLAPEDVIAVAKLHFPEIPEPYLKLIAARAITSEGYLKSVDLSARRARFLAQERGHVRVQRDDIVDAIEQMMPGTVAPQPHRADPAATAHPARAPLSDSPLAAGRRASIEALPVQTDRANRAPKREDELSEATA